MLFGRCQFESRLCLYPYVSQKFNVPVNIHVNHRVALLTERHRQVTLRRRRIFLNDIRWTILPSAGPDAEAGALNVILGELRGLRNELGELRGLRNELGRMCARMSAQEAAFVEVRAQLDFLKSNSKKIDSRINSVLHGIDASNADTRCEMMAVKEIAVTHERPAKTSVLVRYACCFRIIRREMEICRSRP